MKYIKHLLLTTLFAIFIHCGLAVFLIREPITASYWVNEALVIKRKITTSINGKRKIVVAGGSSTLFGIDAIQIEKETGIPTVNFGLHAAMSLDRLLSELPKQLNSGDILILALEPYYYGCDPKLNSWRITSIVAWDHKVWDNMRASEKLEFIAAIPLPQLFEMASVRVKRSVHSSQIKPRLDAQNDSIILHKFANRMPPKEFKYSAYNLDDHGDLEGAIGNQYFGIGRSAVDPSEVCKETAEYLTTFTSQLRKRDIQIWFSNVPYIANHQASVDSIANSEHKFKSSLSPAGQMIDNRIDVMLDQKYFYNTDLHLNQDGRSIRTERLIAALRNRL